ncbi:copper resistance D family protein [Calidifontibacter terrae]
MSLVAASVDAHYVIPPVWRLLTKFGWFLGLAGIIGTLITHVAVIRPTTPPADLLRRSRQVVLAAAILMVPLAYLQLASAVVRKKQADSFGAALSPSTIADFLTSPGTSKEWVSNGTVTLVQEALILLVLACAVVLVRRGNEAAATIGLVAAVAVTVGPALPNEPTGTVDLVGSLMIQTHIVGGSIWAGGLISLAVLAATGRAVGGDWAAIWGRFSFAAMYAVGAILLSGLWLTYREVGSVAQLWQTGFGRVLLIKVALVGGLLVAGAYNQLVVLPRVARDIATGNEGGVIAATLHHLPRVVIVESALVVGVLAVVPFLAGSARAEGGSDDAPVSSMELFGAGLIAAALLVVSFWLTVTAAGKRGRVVTA